MWQAVEAHDAVHTLHSNHTRAQTHRRASVQMVYLQGKIIIKLVVHFCRVCPREALVLVHCTSLYTSKHR